METKPDDPIVIASCDRLTALFPDKRQTSEVTLEKAIPLFDELLFLIAYLLQRYPRLYWIALQKAEEFDTAWAHKKTKDAQTWRDRHFSRRLKELKPVFIQPIMM